MAGLTEKQRKFSELYARTGNVVESARGAGYSEYWATKCSHLLPRNEKVIKEVKRLRSRYNERAEKSAVDVINEYSVIAFSDRTGFLKEDPDKPGCFCYKAPHELTDDQKKCIEHISIRRHVVKKATATKPEEVVERYEYIFIAKETALNQMGRHFGIFDDKLRLSVNGNNEFKNLSTDKLLKLKQAFTSVMSGDKKLIEGQVVGRED